MRPATILVASLLALAACNVATSSPSPERQSPSPTQTAISADLPPDGSWQVELSAEDLVTAGLPPDATSLGTYTWTFADGRATIEVRADDGSRGYCEAAMTPEAGNFRLIYAGFDCGDEKDVIRWELADDGLHLFLISTNAPVEGNKAYLETKVWQPIEPVVSTASRLTAHVAGEEGAPLGYYEYLPPGYGDAPRPLLVMLHGYGESGDGSQAELALLLQTGIPSLIRRNAWPEDRPFVVLAPQHDLPRDVEPYVPCEGVKFVGSCWLEVQHQLAHPADRSKCMTPSEVNEFLSYAIARYEVDARRVYLTGLSCGAYAAYEYVAEYGATQIAAMVPIAGDARPALEASACELGAVAIWAFHGDADDLVDPDGSIQPMTSLLACPQPPRQEIELTVYPGVDHDSWTRTYDGSAGNDIYEWLLRFSLP